MIEDRLGCGSHLAQMKEGIKGSRLSYAAPAPDGVFNENFPLSPSHQPPLSFESKKIESKKSKFESSWIRFFPFELIGSPSLILNPKS
jgi:hypothetical protein